MRIWRVVVGRYIAERAAVHVRNSSETAKAVTLSPRIAKGTVRVVRHPLPSARLPRSLLAARAGASQLTRRLAHAYPPALRSSAFWPAQVFSWTYVRSDAAAAGAMYSAAAAQPTPPADGTSSEFKLRLRAVTPIRTLGTPRKQGKPCTLDASKSANGMGPLCTDSDNHQARCAPPGPPPARFSQWSALHRLRCASGVDPFHLAWLRTAQRVTHAPTVVRRCAAWAHCWPTVVCQISRERFRSEPAADLRHQQAD